MARSEARIAVSIWTDPDFLALGPGAQRMFMFLVSQHDLAHDGVLALRERRWSKAAAGLSVEQVRADLSGLRGARFLVVDEDAEELLIRSFIRRDKVYRQPNVLRAAADHLATVSSAIILRAIGDELARISELDDIPEGSKGVLEDMRAITGKAPKDPSGGGSRNPSGNPSGGTPGERGMVTAVGSASPYPVPRASGPVPPSLPPVAPPALAAFDAEAGAQVELFIVPTPSAALVAVDPENAGQLTKQWIDYCTANNVKLTDTAIKRYGRQIKSALSQGFTVDHIKNALGGMLKDRVVSRPALLDSYLIRIQQGPELPPERLARHQADAERRATADGYTNSTARLHDILTREA